jgi:hypothetical protein
MPWTMVRSRKKQCRSAGVSKANAKWLHTRGPTLWQPHCVSTNTLRPQLDQTVLPYEQLPKTK